MTFNRTEMQDTLGDEALDLTKPKINSPEMRRPVTPSMDALEKQTQSMLPNVNVQHPHSKCVSVFSPNLPESATTETRKLAHHQFHQFVAAAVPSQIRAFNPPFHSYDLNPGPHQMMPIFQQQLARIPPPIMIPTISKMPPDEMNMNRFPKQEMSAEEENNNNDFNMRDQVDSTVRTSPSISCSSESEYSMDFGKPHEMIKAKRPFKMYAKDLMSNSFSRLDFENQEEYEVYKAQVLERMEQNSKTTNKNMRRSTAYSQEDKHSDPAYRERRRKNNAAAKRSRDARRAKEDEMAIRCEFLTRANIKLKQDIAVATDREERLRHELERLNTIVMSYQTK